MFPGLAHNTILYIYDRHQEAGTEQEDRRKLYDKRILPLLAKHDLAVFGDEIDGDLWDYYRGLGMAGISRENIFCVPAHAQYSSLTTALLATPSAIQAIKKRAPDLTIPCIVSKETLLLSRKLNSRLLSEPRAVELVSNKAEYRKMLRQLGFDLVPGFRVKSFNDAGRCFCELRNKGFKRAVLKKERSAGGFGVFVVKTEPELIRCLREQFESGESFLVEGYVDDILFSPNVQHWITPRRSFLVSLSDQLFSGEGTSHAGNSVPSRLASMSAVRKKLMAYSRRLCQALRQKRIYGLVGIDYMITSAGGIYSPELNCRLNQSTFPVLIVKKLFRSERDNIAWKSFAVKGRPLAFARLLARCGNKFITRKRRYGIFPIEVGLLALTGEAEFLAAGRDCSQVERLHAEFMSVYERTGAMR